MVNGAVTRTLIADDQPDVLEALRLLLKGEGYQIKTVTSPAAVLATLQVEDFDLLLMDLNYARDTTSGQEGLDLLTRIQALDSTLPIIAMTAWGSIPLAVEAMRRGVCDFVLKPWENRQLHETLRTEVERSRSSREQQWLEGQELKQAAEIERGLLPRNIPQIPGYQVAASWRPARPVGGDYFDAFRLSETRLGLCIGDAVGKGMPAALLMSNVQAAVRSLAAANVEPAELCRRVNQVLCGSLTTGKFVTFFSCLLDAATNRLSYASAGHEPPILLRATGEIARLTEGGPVLGVFPEVHYEQGRSSWRPATAWFCSPTASINRFTGGDAKDDVTLVIVSAAGRSDA